MTSQKEVHDFFNKYVFGYMCVDIEREIAIARSGQLAGNFLCALGLLAYTEFMGGLLLKELGSRETGKLFNMFFDYMGTGYKTFREKHDVYSIFRCGLAHEYFVKHKCTIFMLNISNPTTVLGTISGIGPSLYIPDSTLSPPINIGIGEAPNGRFFFIVEKYYQDFRSACEQLGEELEKNPKGVFPGFVEDWWAFQELEMTSNETLHNTDMKRIQD